MNLSIDFFLKSRSTFSLVSFFFLVLLNTSHAQEDFDVCRLLYHHYIYQNIADNGGRERAELYDRIFLNDYLHPNKKVRQAIYQYLADSPVKNEILTGMERMLPDDLERVARLLKSMEPSERTRALSTEADWENWIENRFSKKNDPISNNAQDYVLVDGAKVQKKKFKELEKIKNDLEKDGIFSHISTGPELNRTGDALLVIDRVEKKASARRLRSMDPVLKSADFEGFLSKAQSQDGAIVIHPSENKALLGYFWENPDVVPGKKWVLALRPDSNGSTFIHEWQHKLDRIDQADRYYDSLVYTQAFPDFSDNRLRKAMQFTGAHLENRYLSELNATAREYKLFFESRQFPPREILSVMLYRAENMKKVAIGRIFWDPLHPKHYALYIYSRGLVYLPKAVVLGALGGAGYYGTHEFLKFISDLSSEK